MIKLGKREKTIIAAIGAATFIAVFYFLVISPLLDRISQVQTQIRQYELRLKEALTMQARKDEIRKEYEQYSSYLKIENLSRQDYEGKFFKELESISYSSKISIVSLSIADIQEQENFTVYQANLRAEGKLGDILNFFDLIEKSNLLIGINDFSVSPKDEKARTLQLDAELHMYIPQV